MRIPQRDPQSEIHECMASSSPRRRLRPSSPPHCQRVCSHDFYSSFSFLPTIAPWSPALTLKPTGVASCVLHERFNADKASNLLLDSATQDSLSTHPHRTATHLVTLANLKASWYVSLSSVLISITDNLTPGLSRRDYTSHMSGQRFLFHTLVLRDRLTDHFPERV